MISRRALFGIGAGAAAAAVMPAPDAGASLEAEFRNEVIVGLDFGPKPAALVFHKCRPSCAHTMKFWEEQWLRENRPRIIADSEFRHVERCG